MAYGLHVALSSAAWDIVLAPGESILLQTTLGITDDTVLTATVSGDVAVTVQKAVTMGERVALEVTPEQTYKAGPVEVPFTIANTGLLNVEFTITFTLEGQVVTSEVSVPQHPPR